MANKNLFQQVELTTPDRNTFDLSHDVKMTMDMGVLTPILALETLPGDNFSLGSEALVRFSPLIAPIMHRVDIYTHYFFVPNRLIWDNWEDFITNPNSTHAHPYFVYDETISATWGKHFEYFGFPRRPSGTAAGIGPRCNPFPLQAYQLIWNDWYRDQNLIPEYTTKLTDGENVSQLTTLATTRRRAWEHDYFTSALPWAQKGAEVSIPIGDVQLKQNPDGTMRQLVRDTQLNTEPSVSAFRSDTNGNLIDQATTNILLDPNGTLEVNSTTITTLRRAFRLQEWLERNARAGTRYIENILAHFGVRTSDYRLQRPEYICGNKSPLQISEVLSTYGNSTTETPQGNMSGHAVAYVNDGNENYYCEEHGWIIGICSIIPKTAYQQGVYKPLLKGKDLFDYFWTSFENIGEQEILNDEIYAFTPEGSETFGYIPRYSEYKYHPNRVAGDFVDVLDHWHLGRIFATPPALNQAFVECTPDDRIFAVVDPAEQKIYVQFVNKIQATRPMQYFGSPKM